MLSPRASSARRSSRLLRMASAPTSRAGSTMSEKPRRSLRWKVTAQTYPPFASLDGSAARPMLASPARFGNPGDLCIYEGFRCRLSDALLAKYTSNTFEDFGTIARTTFGGQRIGSLRINPDHPRWEIVTEFGFPFLGEIAHKVGRTSGWTQRTGRRDLCGRALVGDGPCPVLSGHRACRGRARATAARRCSRESARAKSRSPESCGARDGRRRGAALRVQRVGKHRPSSSGP